MSSISILRQLKIKKKKLKNRKEEDFGFTCYLNILKMFLKKKGPFSSLTLNDAVLDKINFAVYYECLLS